jgi:hypothetical protein
LRIELNKLVDVDAIIFFDNLILDPIILVFIEKELLESLTIVLWQVTKSLTMPFSWQSS